MKKNEVVIFKTTIVVHWVCIKVYRNKYSNSGIIHFLKWDNMLFPVRTKWDWYFTYRAALLQVRYPKSRVEIFSGTDTPHEKTLLQIKNNAIRAKKAQITKINNLICEVEKNYMSLFPLSDLDVYKNACNKRNRLLQELDLLMISSI
jgi:hypothetical protein